MRLRPALFGLLVLGATSCSTPESSPGLTPESKQAAQATKIIDAYHIDAYHNPRPAQPPKVLHVIYFTPSDRDPVPDYEQRLGAIFEDIQSFYRGEMQRNGFGPKTFGLERDPQGKLLIRLVKGKKTKVEYEKTWEHRNQTVGDECWPVLVAAGVSPEEETVAIVCNLADWDETTHKFSHPTPYSGQWTQQWGLCWLMDSPILNIDYLMRKEPVVDDFQFGDVPLGKRNSMFIGSIAHELGHSFGLPHNGRRRDEVQTIGASLMGLGNLTYHDERRGEDRGTSLTMAGAMRLAGRPIFNGSDKGMMEKPQLEECDLTFSTNVTSASLARRPATIRIQGTVKGSPPIYGVIAYFNSLRDGGYRAPAATAVPDANGHFAIETSDLARCANGLLTVAVCHVNGGVSEREFHFTVSPQNIVDVQR